MYKWIQHAARKINSLIYIIGKIFHNLPLIIISYENVSWAWPVPHWFHSLVVRRSFRSKMKNIGISQKNGFTTMMNLSYEWKAKHLFAESQKVVKWTFPSNDWGNCRELQIKASLSSWTLSVRECRDILSFTIYSLSTCTNLSVFN